MQHGQLPVLHGGNSARRGASFVTKESTADSEGKEDEEENKGRKTSVPIPQIYLLWHNHEKEMEGRRCAPKAQLDFVFENDSFLLVTKSDI